MPGRPVSSTVFLLWCIALYLVGAILMPACLRAVGWLDNPRSEVPTSSQSPVPSPPSP